jgi:hypothetical protein
MDKSKMMMAIIIALLVLLLGTVVGVGFYLISITEPDTVWDRPYDPVAGGELRPADLRTVSLGENMIAILAPGPNGRTDNLSLEVQVGLNAIIPESELEEFYGIFTRGIPIARAEVIDMFLGKTFDEVRTSEGMNAAAETLKFRLQEAFGSNLIVSVSFSSWTPVRGR